MAHLVFSCENRLMSNLLLYHHPRPSNDDMKSRDLPLPWKDCRVQDKDRSDGRHADPEVLLATGSDPGIGLSVSTAVSWAPHNREPYGI
jgi:hypothetical protein